MDPEPNRQLEINFAAASAQHGGSGLDRWRQAREAALRKLARRLGVPLGHPVEVRLRDGIVVRGQLRLREELLWVEPTRDTHLELIVDRVTFTAADIESCVRLD
jgi:hypothetical protein